MSGKRSGGVLDDSFEIVHCFSPRPRVLPKIPVPLPEKSILFSKRTKLRLKSDLSRTPPAMHGTSHCVDLLYLDLT